MNAFLQNCNSADFIGLNGIDSFFLNGIHIFESNMLGIA